MHVAWPSCAWLQLIFFPFPVGNPMSAGCILSSPRGAKRNKLGNVWVFEKLIHRPIKTENQLYKNQNIAKYCTVIEDGLLRRDDIVRSLLRRAEGWVGGVGGGSSLGGDSLGDACSFVSCFVSQISAPNSGIGFCIIFQNSGNWRYLLSFQSNGIDSSLVLT